MPELNAALERLRARLNVAPGTDADARLQSAAADLIERTDAGAVVRGLPPAAAGASYLRGVGGRELLSEQGAAYDEEDE